MGLFYPYRESKLGDEPIFAVVERPGHPDEYWLSAIRTKCRLGCYCTHQASGRWLAVRTDYKPGTLPHASGVRTRTLRPDGLSAVPHKSLYSQTLVMFWWVLLMLGISLTLFKVVPIWVMSLPWDTPCYLGSLLNRLLSLLLQTMLRSSPWCCSLVYMVKVHSYTFKKYMWFELNHWWTHVHLWG